VVDASEVISDESSDGSLLRQLRRGSQDAATQLYLRYVQRLRELAAARAPADLAARVDADDIVQSVFRIFFTRAQQGQYAVPSGEDLWQLLLVITMNKIRGCHRFHRKAKRDVRQTTSVQGFDEMEHVCLQHKDVGQAFLALTVQETLGSLAERHRRIVELRVAGHEVADIARMIGRSKRTVERVLQEARDLLRSLLDLE
jgi:RNA polymerase sigma-70 factor (ECF subfamily)